MRLVDEKSVIVSTQGVVVSLQKNSSGSDRGEFRDSVFKLSTKGLLSALVLATMASAHAQEAAPIASDPADASPGQVEVETNAPTGATTAAETPATPTATASGAAEVEEIVVTGSRIVRNGYDTPTPVTVIGEADLQASGRSNVADFVNELPSVAGSTAPATSNRSISGGTAGISSINLRSLGNNRTLVLLDGKRSVGSIANGTVDINTFPQALVKNVEIVTGGASSVYGSDAVSGVVNFILDRKYTGVKGSVEAGETTYGDDRSWLGTLTIGQPFADGRGHFLINGEMSRRDGIFGVPRQWAEKGWYMVQNPAYAAGNGQAQYMPTSQAGMAVMTPGGIITSVGFRNANGTITQRTNTALQGNYFGGNGVVNQFNYGAVGGQWTVGGDWKQGQSYDRTSLEPESNRDGLFTRLSFDVADNLNVFAEASYNKNEAYQWGGTNSDKGSVVIRADNAFIPDEVAAQLAEMGAYQFNLGTSNSDIPTRITDNKREVQRYVLGFEGSFDVGAQGFKWDGYYQKGITDAHEGLYVYNTQRLAWAQDAIEVNGQIVCRATANGVAGAEGCVPFNRMGVGVNDPSAVDYFMGSPYRKQKFEQDVAAINFSTSVDNPWFKPIGVAFGAEHRVEKISGSVDPQYSNGWAFGNFLVTDGKYDVTEAYVELSVPITDTLEFTGAARGTDYSESGYVTTWKTGLGWSPFDDLKLRITKSRDIRAPNLQELFQAGQRRTNFISNPYQNDLSMRFTETTMGNTDLKPEKADTLGLGLIYRPSFVPGLGFSVDYYDIKINDAISTVVAQDIVDRCFAGITQFCGQVSTTDGLSLATTQSDILINNQPLNFVSQRARGLDLEASYSIPMATISDGLEGMLSFRALATHYLEMSSNNGVDGNIDRAGQNTSEGPPDWRYRLSATYNLDRFTFMLTGRGISSGVYDNTYIECNGDCPVSTGRNRTITNNKIAGAFYVDTFFSYNLGASGKSNNQVFFKIMNFFNEDPEAVGLGPADSSNVEPGINRALYDYLGRTFRVGYRFEF